jgi:oligogalacturonide transport system substrate-binding protein
MNAVDLFKENNPTINVSYQYGAWNGFEKRMKVWLESRKQADVMQINYAWLSEYSSDGNGFYDLYQLSDYIDLSNFTDSDLKLGEKNGKLNAIPIALNTPTMYYNKSIFDSYGLDLPTTWQDFFDDAAVMKKDGIYLLGMEERHLFLLLISYYEQSTGNRFFSEDGKLSATSSDIASMLTFYKKLLDEKVLLPVDQYSNTKFASGELAGSVFWISDADNYCSTVEENGGNPVIGEYPMLEGATISGWYMKPATMYAISNITEAPEASAKLLDFLLNSEEMADLQKTEKGVPVSQSALAELKEQNLLDGYGYQAAEKMTENKETMELMIPIMENEDILSTFKSESYEYIYGKASLDECANDIYEGINSIIEESN